MPNFFIAPCTGWVQAKHDQCDPNAPGNRVKNPSDGSDPQLPLFHAQIFPQQGLKNCPGKGFQKYIIYIYICLPGWGTCAPILLSSLRWGIKNLYGHLNPK